MRTLDLFAGIGGLSLAAEEAGMEIVGHCEIDPFCQQILQARWPDVEMIADVREVHYEPGQIEVVCGGFPCQDLSVAGRQAGLGGERSGLWFEMLRVVREAQPTWVVAENVRGAVNNALDVVCAGLGAAGYEVWPFVLPASAVGAPHKRERLFVLGCRVDEADWLLSMEMPEADPEAGEWPLHQEFWPTPRVSRAGKLSAAKWLARQDTLPEKYGMPLQIAAQIAQWPTPRATEYKGVGPIGSSSHKFRLDKHYLDATVQEAEKVTGRLNPDWVELLMGFPQGWTDPNVATEDLPKWWGWPAGPQETLWATPAGMLCDPGDPEIWEARKKIYPNNGKPIGIQAQQNAGAAQFNYEPPRLTERKQYRAKRIKALGNAVVPAQAAPFFRAIAVLEGIADD